MNASTRLDLPCLPRPATMLDSNACDSAAGTIVVVSDAAATPPSDEEAAETISDGCLSPIAPPPAFDSLRATGGLLAPRFRWPRLARVTSKLPRLPRPSQRWR